MMCIIFVINLILYVSPHATVYIQLKDSLVWVQRFLATSLAVVKGEGYQDDLLMDLSLLWKQIKKHFLSSRHFKLQ